jgi:hypothetical protein
MFRSAIKARVYLWHGAPGVSFLPLSDLRVFVVKNRHELPDLLCLRTIAFLAVAESH